GIGRTRRTQFNWVVSGAAAIVNVVLNVLLVPRYGMVGSAIAALGAYVALFGGMVLNAGRVYPVAYQWRRGLPATVVAAALSAVARVLEVPLAAALVLALAFPLALLPFGFYLPAELRRMRRLLPAFR